MGEKTETFKVTSRIQAWVKTIVLIFTSLGTVAGAVFGVYLAWKEIEKGDEKAEDYAKLSYAAMQSKINALSQRVAYLEGKMDGREVRVIRAPTARRPAAHLGISADMIPTAVAVESDEPMSEPEPEPEEKSIYRKGAKFNVEAYEDLPDSLDELVQTQEQYQEEAH